MSKIFSYKNPAGTPEWNLEEIQVPEAWGLGYSGQGVVVGNIDTGVLHTHSALRGNYVGEHGWYDPYGETELPNDQNGHGTVSGGHKFQTVIKIYIKLLYTFNLKLFFLF